MDGITNSMGMNLTKLQEIFPIQGSNPGLPQADSLPAEPQGKPLRRLRAEEFMLLNCDARGDSSESFGQHGDQKNQSHRESTLNTHCKD